MSSDTGWDSADFRRRTVLRSLGTAGAVGLGADVASTVREARASPRLAGEDPPEFPVVRGSTEQVLVVSATEAATLTLTGPDGETIESATADDFGSYAFRGVDPGEGYTVTETVDGEETTLAESVTVLSPDYTPPQALYDEQTLDTGFGYFEVRDGTKLAYQVQFPSGEPPYPTLVVYSGYAPSVNLLVPPAVTDLLGYAVVGVNKRGSQCSGGKYDLWEYLQWLDGYDTIETVAAQDWADGVGMLGASYSGYSQLYVAATQPPSLDCIAPAMPVGDFYRGVGYPGGMLNSAFAAGWAQSRDVENAPYPDDPGFGDVDERVETDPVCDANQLLGLQNASTLGRLLDNPFSGPFYDNRSPWTFVEDIEVPTLLAAAWQDEQVGSRSVRLLEQFDDDTPVRFVGLNGDHMGFLAGLPQALTFYTFYVEESVPLGYEGSYEEALATYEAEDPVTVLWETDHSYASRFSTTHAEWPPGETWELFFGSDGTLTGEPPQQAASSSYEYVAPDEQTQTLPRTDGKLVWEQGAEGPGVAFRSEILTEDHLLLGSGLVDLWLAATASDTDIQVMLSELRPDGQEMYVQSGWLRASHRAEDLELSKPRRPWHTHRPEDQEPLPDDEFARARVELLPFGHVFRRGSRVKLTVCNPAGTRDRWAFDVIEETGTNEVAHGPAHPSRVELPLVPGEQAPLSSRPACGEVRHQPCRPSEIGPVELPPLAGDTRPQDPDDDGLYEDITGSGGPTIFDVQALFDKLDSPAVQEYAWAYNFSHTNPDRASIFDVQALYARIDG